MNDREVFDMLLEKHPTWMENIKLKGRIDERARMLAPYDVESIEELIQNVRAKTIEEMYAKTKEMIDIVCKGDTRPHFAWDIVFRELWVGLNKIAEEMKGDKK